jgi:hypothetical protein
VQRCGAVRAGGGEEPAVRAEVDAIHQVAVASQRQQLIPGFEIPQPDGAVITAGSDPGPGRVDVDLVDPSGVAAGV